MHANFIDGAWLDGVDARPNINPSNLADVVGDYAQADAAQAGMAIAAASAAAHAWAAAL
ncbi:aldehyde dehydrogenase family protein, partial [Bordetella pertussis]